jgi:Plant transposon protein
MDLTWFYLLADGICPAFRMFLSTIRVPRTLSEKVFCKTQKSARKAVERVFGVLFKRFSILYQPSRLWALDDMGCIAEACCILHNMNVAVRKPPYRGTNPVQVNADETRLPTDIRRIDD